MLELDNEKIEKALNGEFGTTAKRMFDVGLTLLNPPNLENEEWKDIPNYSKYQASSQGRIKNKETNHVRVDFLKNTGGYSRLQLRKDGESINVSVHRIVAETFLEASENRTVVNHKNGIPFDNRVENLEWSTQSENVRHGFAMRANEEAHSLSVLDLNVYLDIPSNINNTYQRTPLKRNCKLTYRKADNIRVFYRQGKTINELAKKYGVSDNTIWKVLKGKIYT